MSNKEKIQKIYPLSPMQEGMLLYALLNQDKHKQTYFEQQALRISGIFDVKIYEESINKIIERYDILRTIFVHSNIKRPVQVVLKENKIKIHFEDISHLTEDEKEEFIKVFKEKDIESGFDLSKKVPIRFSVLKI
ncbi:MAG: condensation domain-containing protein, partial [Bacillota bacterium]|nr:condensation domain-containing protein [Bacillota bacterium]